MNIVQFMDQFPIGYQLSACPIVSMIKLLKRRIIQYMMSCFFFFFVVVFVNRFFVCFQESFSTTVSSRYSVCRWIFFSETTVEPRLSQTCLKYSYILELSCCYFQIALFLNALFFFFFFCVYFNL